MAYGAISTNLTTTTGAYVLSYSPQRDLLYYVWMSIWMLYFPPFKMKLWVTPVEFLLTRYQWRHQSCATGGAGSPGKGAKTDHNVWPLPQFKNFHRHECFDDSRFCLIFSFGGNYKILVETNIFWWKLIFFGGNWSWWKLFRWKLFFGGNVWSMNSKKGTTSNLKDLQIQCSKGTSIFTSWSCLCLALFVLLFSHDFTLGNLLPSMIKPAHLKTFL
jgi:hypothetical protein